MRPVLVLALLAPAAAQHVTVPGLRHAPEDPRLAGELLFEELRCAACHGGAFPAAPPGPDLAAVGERLSPSYLLRFLRDPAAADPGTGMPHLLGGAPEEDARDLAAFLASGGGFERGRPEAADVEHGRKLYHEVGCVACHAPRVPAEPGGRVPAVEGVVSLEHVPAKYGLEGLAAFLFRPTTVRPAGRMPDLKLTRDEARAVASYLLEGEARTAGPVPAPGDPERGRRRFEALGCAACHDVPGVTAGPPPAPSLEEADPTAGCLAAEPGAGVPRYALDEGQRAALRSVVADGPASRSGEERVLATLLRFDCLACHERDGLGGVTPAIDPYFRTDEPDLGDHARLPPALTLAGAKLREDLMRRVIFDGRGVRPYVRARMPRFVERDLAHLPALLAQVDRVEPYPARAPEPGEEEKAWRAAGRELLGIRGLACISCHDFNYQRSPTFSGVDLITSPQRLRYDWFARFLIDPQRYRPGIVMPESWPGGVAAHPDILGGDTETQIQALWHFLRLGRSAPDPEGLVPERTNLEVTDGVRTYRGRSRVAGFRGIAVGFPAGISYAFDARTGALAAIWRGEFVSVSWQGQGAGDFRPRGRPVTLPRDVAFVRLEDPVAPWPRRPVTTKEAPVDPDPLYPRQHGYRFLGYRLDGDDVPTLRYRVAGARVEDRSVADLDGGRALLHRRLSLQAPEPCTLHLRLLTGELEEVDANTVEVEGLRLTHPDVPRRIRPLDDGTRELILRLDLPAGETILDLTYELLP